MSHSFIDRSSNYFTQNYDNEETQKKIDPIAQLKELNDTTVREWWPFNNPPAKLFAKEDIKQEDENSTENIELEEQTTSGHGVTNSATKLNCTIKNGKPLRKNKEVEIPSEKELMIKGDISGETITVSVEIDRLIYEGTILKSTVNISPNSLDEIDTEDKKNIVRVTASRSGWGKKATDECYINYGNELPAELHFFIKTELDKYVSSGQALSDVNRTVTLPVKFDNLGYVADLSDFDREKYADKTFVYRFTRFNNGNTKDVILVEELAGNIVSESLSEEEKKNIALIFAENGFSFIESDAEAASADAELKSKLGKASASEIEALHAKAYLPLTDSEKEAVMSGVAKLPESALKDIQGLKFGKKSCKLDDNNKSIASIPAPNAYYSPDDHEVILVNAGSISVNNLFGDKDGSNFIDRMEYTVLHEIGHAVDYAPYNKDKGEYFNTLTEKSKSSNLAGENAKKAAADYNSFIKMHNYKIPKTGPIRDKRNLLDNDATKKKSDYESLKTEYNNYLVSLNGKKFKTSSGVGNEINVAGNSITYTAVTDVTDFTLALKLDSPNITIYSDKNVKEAYAEAFALYISEPKSLQILSPNVYEYFNNKYPQ